MRRRRRQFQKNNMAAFNYKEEYERYKKYYLSLEPVLNKPTNRAYTSVIFSFLAVSLFGWYAIRPTMQTIFTLKREISDRTTVDKQMEDKISALIEAQAAYDNVQNVLPVLSDALPQNSAPADAAVQLRGLADDTGVTVVALSVPTVNLSEKSVKTSNPTAGKVVSVPINISVSGTYAQVKSYLEGIPNLLRITQITGLTFSPKKLTPTATASATPAPATGSNIQVDLKLNVFYITQ